MRDGSWKDLRVVVLSAFRKVVHGIVDEALDVVLGKESRKRREDEF